MSEHHGRLWTPGDSEGAVDGTVEISGDRIIVKAAGSVLAEWDRRDVVAQAREVGFYLTVGEDELMFQPRTAGFDHAIGLSTLADRLSAASASNASIRSHATPDIATGPTAEAFVPPATQRRRKRRAWIFGTVVGVGALVALNLTLGYLGYGADEETTTSLAYSQADKEALLHVALVSSGGGWTGSSLDNATDIAYRLCDLAETSGSGPDLIANLVAMGPGVQAEMAGALVFVIAVTDFCPTSLQQRVVENANARLAKLGSG